MRIFGSVPFSVSRVALSVALAAGVAFAASDVDAQSRGGKPSVGSGGGHGGWHGGSGGRGGWHGGSRDGWRGGNHGGWRGGDHGRWHGGHGHHGWHGGRYFYPGWALGLGVGIGLTYPWWGWGYPYYAYPSSYVVYERAYDAPAGVVIDRDIPITSQPAPAYRWYCPSPPGYHPDVRDCSAGWLKVLPPEGGPSSPPSAPPPSTTPRSSAPSDDAAPGSRIAPGTMGSASSPVRIAAPRMTPPAAIAHGYTQDTLAQNAAQ
jgi:hypothetical protein